MQGINFAAITVLIIHIILIVAVFVAETVDSNTVWILVFLALINFHVSIIAQIKANEYRDKLTRKTETDESQI